MAIYHLCIKTFSRSDGETAVAAAAYRSGERLVDDRLGITADYTRRGGVLRDKGLLVLPSGSANWSRGELWNAAEAAEKRKNSTVAREVEISLPSELEEACRVKLAHDFGRYLSSRYGCAADVQLHEPVKGDDNRNFHSHILLSTRVLGPAGFGEKTRVLDSKQTGPLEVEAIRMKWADRVNHALSSAGLEARVDHRSNERRGISDAPTVHVGRGKRVSERAAYNSTIRGIDAELKTLLAERAAMMAAETRKNAERAAHNSLGTKQGNLDLFSLRPVKKAGQAERLQRKITSKILPLRQKIQQDSRLSKAGFESIDKVHQARKVVFAWSKELYNATRDLAGIDNPLAKQKGKLLEKPSALHLRALRVWAISVHGDGKKAKKRRPKTPFNWVVGLSTAKKRDAAKRAEEEAQFEKLLETIRVLLAFLFGAESKNRNSQVNLAQQQSLVERLDQLERRLAIAANTSRMETKELPQNNVAPLPLIRETSSKLRFPQGR